MYYSIRRQSKSFIKKHYKALFVISFAIFSAIAANFSLTTYASITNTRADAWGTLELAGSDGGNISGDGVDIYSNGASVAYTPNKPNNTVTVNGTNVVSGEKWQCVELINRLYLTNGWTTSTWTGNGDQIYANAPSGLTKEANGSINSVSPGDVLSLDYNADTWGHTNIVSSVSGSTITIVNQNTGAVYSTATYNSSTKTITLSGWTGYSVIGIIHHPSGAGGGGGSSWGGVGNANFRGESLPSGDILYRNEYLSSSNGQYALIFQNDSNIVLYQNGSIYTIPNSLNSGADRLIMQTDGNLVLYRPNSTVVWHSVTSGHPGSWANLQSDGNLVVRDGGAAYFASGTGGHPNLTYFGTYLDSGQQLTHNEYLRSPDWRYTFLMQTDGNAVVYGPGAHPLYATNVSGQGDRIVMQTDGNLVIYALSVPKWWRGPYGSNAPTTNLQSDGNLVIRIGGTSGTAVWTRPNWVSGQI